MLAGFHPPLRNVQANPWVGIIAELHPIKRHHLLLSAFADVLRMHPTARLICIGDGELKTELLSRRAALGLEEHVFFLGSVADAARFLPAFDLTTLPSRSESYGYVVHESGLAKVPVVATAVGGITDIITGPAFGLLIPPDDQAALTSALGALLDSPHDRERLGTALHEHVRDRSVSTMVQATDTLYRHTLGR
jgi:glycosyltransferase involved in cell wall biosynthesis